MNLAELGGKCTRYPVWGQVSSSVGDLVWKAARAAIWDAVGDSVRDLVRDSVHDSVWAANWDYARAQEVTHEFR